MLLILRCTTFIGVCVEFVAAVAWLAELFPNPSSARSVLGYTQAFSSIGGLLVGGAVPGSPITAAGRAARRSPCRSSSSVLGEIVEQPHAPWRYTLMSGLIPAIPLIIIRPFLPESPIWAAEEGGGHAQAAELRRAVLARVRAHDDRHDDHVRVQLRRRVRRHPADAADRARPAGGRGRHGAAKRRMQRTKRAGESKSRRRAKRPDEGRCREARAADRRHDRRPAARLPRRSAAWSGGSCWRCSSSASSAGAACCASSRCPGLLVHAAGLRLLRASTTEVLFDGGRRAQVTLLHVGMFLAGLFTVAQFSFWGNYLPRSTRCTCAAPARASPPTSAAA